LTARYLGATQRGLLAALCDTASDGVEILKTRLPQRGRSNSDTSLIMVDA
jgi:hypothetical protein